VKRSCLWPRLFHHPLRFPIADDHYAMGFAFLYEASGDSAAPEELTSRAGVAAGQKWQRRRADGKATGARDTSAHSSQCRRRTSANGEQGPELGLECFVERGLTTGAGFADVGQMGCRMTVVSSDS